jgi:hypothetical protein
MVNKKQPRQKRIARPKVSDQNTILCQQKNNESYFNCFLSCEHPEFGNIKTDYVSQRVYDILKDLSKKPGKIVLYAKYEFKTESGYDWIDTENLNRVVMFMIQTPGIKLDVQ